MNSKYRNFFLLGIVLAGFVGFGIWSALSKMENLVPIVVATQNIEPYEKITKNMVRVEEIPAIGRSDLAIDDPNMVIDSYTTSRIYAGQTIIQPMALKQFDPNGPSGLAVSISDPDIRAVTFPCTAATAVGGKIKKGDFVDIIASFDGGKLGANTGITKTVLQKVEVFDVVGKDEDISGLTLLVKLPQAEMLTHAYTVGTVSFALCPIESERATTTGVINQRLCEQFGFKCGT